MPMKLRSSLLVAAILTWLFYGNLGITPVAATAQTTTDNFSERFGGIHVSESHPLPLYKFIRQITTGEAGKLVGVYVEGYMSLPVLQQPPGDPTFVSDRPNSLTQFAMASSYGSTGILAHNTLSGALFSGLRLNQKVFLVYGDGTLSEYVITSIDKYQALSPLSPFSDFIDLSQPGKVISSTELFEIRYQSKQDQLVFQTCIAKGLENSWGRIFITAKPVGTDHLIG